MYFITIALAIINTPRDFDTLVLYIGSQDDLYFLTRLTQVIHTTNGRNFQYNIYVVGLVTATSINVMWHLLWRTPGHKTLPLSPFFH